MLKLSSIYKLLYSTTLTFSSCCSYYLNNKILYSMKSLVHKQFIYVHSYMNTSNSCLLLLLATLVNAYLTKSLLHIHPNLTILHKICILCKFVDYCGNILLIMLALCSMPLTPYYAHNYADIIGFSYYTDSQISTIAEVYNTSKCVNAK